MVTTIAIDMSKNQRSPTGTTSVQITEAPNAILPNHLRASRGSCHDFCKFGKKPKLKPSAGTITDDEKVLQERTVKGQRGNKVIKPAAGTKWKSFGSNGRQIDRPVGMSSSNVRTIDRPVGMSSRNVRMTRVEAGKQVQTSKVSTRSSIQPRLSSLSSPRLPIKSRTNKRSLEKASPLGIRDGVGKSQVLTAKSRSSKNIDRKVLQSKTRKAIERFEAEKTDKNQVEADQSPTLTFDSNENQMMYAQGERTVRGPSSRTVVLVEKDVPPIKLRFRKPEVLEIQDGKASPVGRRARRVIPNGKSIHTRSHIIRVDLCHQEVVQSNSNLGLMNTMIEETASKQVQERLGKVKALVGAFESVIKICDSDSLRTSKAKC